MKKNKKKLYAKKKRHLNKIIGVKDNPRLSIFRSSNQIYAQLVDDNSGCTLTSFSTAEVLKRIKIFSNVTKNFKSYFIGRSIANIIANFKIKSIIFDRGKNPYKGRIKNLAEGIRKDYTQF